MEHDAMILPARQARALNPWSQGTGHTEVSGGRPILPRLRSGLASRSGVDIRSDGPRTGNRSRTVCIAIIAVLTYANESREPNGRTSLVSCDGCEESMS
jgi:hypothetical protein